LSPSTSPRSSSMMLGLNRSAAVTASRPLPASPTTRMSFSGSRRRREAVRPAFPRSAMTMLITAMVLLSSSNLALPSIELWSHADRLAGEPGVFEDEQRELQAARDAELAEYRRQVGLDRPFGDIEPLGDLLVAGPRAQEVDDLALTRRDAVQA